MVTNDATILRIKHEILYEVAKLAWNDQLEDGRDDIPYKISPGPQAQYRCCVYKEREIVRQRIRLAEGKCPSDRNTNNVVQVINAACEECPIASYTVTDNCRKCMGKACQNSCPFGAISMGNTKAHIDPDKCRECGKCSQACPYNAIAHLERPCKKVCPVDAITYDEYGICVIDEMYPVWRLHPFLPVRCDRFQDLHGRCDPPDQRRQKGRSDAGTGDRRPVWTRHHVCKLENSFKEDWVCRYDRGWSGRRYDRGS